MSAPQRPAEAPIWTTPPGSPPPRRRRSATLAVVVVIAVAGIVAAGAAGLFLLRDPPAATPDAPADAAAAEDAPVEGDTAAEGEGPAGSEEQPAVDPALAELRATDHYVALAEHDRAAAAVAAGIEDFGWNNFAIVHDGQVTHEWTNKAELWDEVVPPIRDELLLLGVPFTEPMWDETNPSPASIGAGWPNDVTGGRGQYIQVTGRYHDEGRATPVEVKWAVLIVTHDDGSGEVVAHMPPVELVPSQATSFRHARELTRLAAWEWVQAQPLQSGEGA